MPPKRKAAAPKKAAGGKKAKATPAKKAAAAAAAVEEEEEEEAGPSTGRDAMAALKTVSKGKKKVRKCKVDAECPHASSGQILEDYDCMLNQTNIGHNNNKYYIIQVIQSGSVFYTWNRWGRVGEKGANATKCHSSKDDAVKDFQKKFKDKSRNNWADRSKFKPFPGKYTLLEMDDDDEGDDEEMKEKLAKLDETDGPAKTVKPCTLDKPTQGLLNLIFNNDMFNHALKELEIDVKKMPLGKLSKSQIAKGFEVLEEIENVLDKGSRAKLTELTSRFYTLIPHDFGRQRPPLIQDEETLRKKMEMLMVLADIELAQAMQEEDKKKPKKTDADTVEVPHPDDVNFGVLNCDMTLMKKTSADYKVLEKYLEATKGTWRAPTIQEVWEVNRHSEGARFKAHDSVSNRRLLWHGTNVAVVAAILKGGLRIMPHSGGRVGKGIYLASENGKSAGYVRTTGPGVGIMFLCEAALGKEHHIKMDDWRLTAPPKGFDSIVAKGHTEPDPKHDTTMTLNGKKVAVPQGKPVSQPKFQTSSFSQSEYLVYKESQCRMRYLLKCKF